MRHNKRKHKKYIKKKAHNAISEIANSNNIKTISFDELLSCNITDKRNNYIHSAILKSKEL